MKISAIVIVRNGERFLAETLHSIGAQTSPPAEVIVVDGASTDQSVAIAHNFAGVTVLHQTSRGMAAARNQGVQAARGELIAFLDADDRWEANKLAQQAHYLATHPQYAAVTGQLLRFAQPGCPIPAQYRENWLNRPVPGYTPGALLLRRTLFDQCGYFDPTLTIGSDSDWLARIHDMGYPVAFLPQVVLHKRIHDSNLSSNLAQARREMLTMTRRSLIRRQILRPALDDAVNGAVNEGANGDNGTVSEATNEEVNEEVNDMRHTIPNRAH